MIYKKFGLLDDFVLFKVQGVMCEELISFCIENGYSLKDIKTSETGFTSLTKARNYKYIAEKSLRLGMRTKVIEKHGIGFVMFRNRKRWGIIAGTIIMIISLFCLSSRLWNIEIKGCEKIPEEIILSSLRDKGIYIGAKVKNPDALDLERKLFCEFDQISLIALNFNGCNLEVIVNEKKNEEYIIDDKRKKYNIIASESGQIAYTEIYDGTAVVKKGQTVSKGDLLISGVTEGKLGYLHFNSASGKVLALTEAKTTEKVDYNQIEYVPTGKIDNIYFIKIGDRQFNFSVAQKPKGIYQKCEKSKYLSLFGVNMPVKIGVESYIYLEEKAIVLSREEAKDICLKNLQDKENDMFRNCKIIEKTMVSKVSLSSFVIEANYLLEKDIGKKQEYFVEF